MSDTQFRDCPFCHRPIKVCRDCRNVPVHGRGRVYCPDCATVRREQGTKRRENAYAQTPYRKQYKKLHSKYRRGLLTREEMDMLLDTYRIAAGEKAVAPPRQPWDA